MMTWPQLLRNLKRLRHGCEALERLAKIDARAARVVKLRYFIGLSVEETAEVLEVSPRTVKSDWAASKAWLSKALGHGAGNGDAAPSAQPVD